MTSWLNTHEAGISYFVSSGTDLQEQTSTNIVIRNKREHQDESEYQDTGRRRRRQQLRTSVSPMSIQTHFQSWPGSVDLVWDVALFLVDNGTVAACLYNPNGSAWLPARELNPNIASAAGSAYITFQLEAFDPALHFLGTFFVDPVVTVNATNPPHLTMHVLQNSELFKDAVCLLNMIRCNQIHVGSLKAAMVRASRNCTGSFLSTATSQPWIANARCGGLFHLDNRTERLFHEMLVHRNHSFPGQHVAAKRRGKVYYHLSRLMRILGEQQVPVIVRDGGPPILACIYDPMNVPAGSWLAAVRNHGFVPFDSDNDFAILDTHRDKLANADLAPYKQTWLWEKDDRGDYESFRIEPDVEGWPIMVTFLPCVWH